MTVVITLFSFLSTTSHVNILCLIPKSEYSVRGTSLEFQVADTPIVFMCQLFKTKLKYPLTYILLPGLKPKLKALPLEVLVLMGKWNHVA